MRPLAVLLLVVGAIAALAFALLRLQESEDPSGSGAARPAAQSPVAAGESSAESLTVPIAGLADPQNDRPANREVVAADPNAVVENWNNFLAGVVLSPAGEPVAEAQVELVRDAAESEVSEVLLMIAGANRTPAEETVVTDEQGGFRFDRLEPGRNWSLRVSHALYQGDTVGPIDVPEEGGVQERIQLQEGFVLHGTVVAAGTQAPVEGAVLRLESPTAAFYGNGSGSGARAQAVTDANGNYEMLNVSPQNKLLVCMADGYATLINQRDLNVLGAPEQRKQVDFELDPGMAIAGRVVAPDGSGVSGLKINALGSNSKGSSRGVTVSGEGGEFAIRDVGEGRYSLRLDKDGLARLKMHSDPIQASAGDTDVEILLIEQGGLMGVVRDDNGPVGRFRVTVRQQHPQNRAFGHIVTRQQFRSEDGSFRVEGLTQGGYVVQVDANGYASSFSEPVQVEQGRITPDVQVRMTVGGRVTGRVLDTYTREPIAGAKVSTFDNNHINAEFTNILTKMAPTALSKVEAVTDEDGRFELALILPDDYQVRVEKRGYTSFTTNDVSVLEGQATHLDTIALSKGGTVRGTAFLSDGGPGAGVRVSLTPLADGMPTAPATARADAQGNFVLQNVPAGRYMLAGSRPAKATASPFSRIGDIRASEVEITVIDGQEVSYDLYLGGN